MANTLTSILDKILARGLLALRKEVPITMAVDQQYSTDAAKFGDVITIPKPIALGTSAVTPAATPPALTDNTPTAAAITLNQWKKSDAFHLSDKDLGSIDSSKNFLPSSISVAVGELADDVNAYIAGLYTSFYGYVGTAGTTPFLTDTSAARDARQVLNQQKAAKTDRALILDYDAYNAAMGLEAIANAARRGNSNVMDTGEIVDAFGYRWFEDGDIPTHTTGAAGTPLVDDTGAVAVGVKTIHMDGLTTKPSVGDIFTIAGDTQTYVVTASTDLVVTDTDVSFEPGLQVALPAGDNNEAVTFKATHVANLAIQRGAIGFASRPLQVAPGSKRIVSQMGDPVSGLTMRIEMIDVYKATAWELDILYGASVIRRELGARIAG